MNYNPYSLDGKTVLVTGASSGIGRVTAVECSTMGAKVIVTGRNSEKLKETFDNLVGDGHIMVTADLNLPEDIEKLVAEIPQIDGFVNNAGVDRNKPINFIKKEDLDFIYQTNVFAGMLLNKALLKKKKINKGASIVFTSSISSKLNFILYINIRQFISYFII